MGLLSTLFPPTVGAGEAHEAVSSGRALLLDVRERGEWKAGHAAGARNVPLSRLAAELGRLEPDRRYVVVCRSGGRSRSAVARLRRAGLDAVNLRGGMLAWQRAGLPLEPRRGRVA